MKCLAVLFSALLCLLPAFTAEALMDISLMDGSKIRGKVVSSTGSDITVMSDLGVFRIPMEKLTPESRRAVAEVTKPDVDALLRKVAELEARISQLQQENESLRKQTASSPAAGVQVPGGNSLTPSSPGTPVRPAAAAGYTISSTGKRHNSGCRYFGTGRACSSTEGTACKICGG